MTYIGSIYKVEELKNTNWSRIHLFYTLFMSLANILFGVQGLKPIDKKNISAKSIGKLRNALDNFSVEYDKIADDIDNDDYSQEFKQFMLTPEIGRLVFKSPACYFAILFNRSSYEESGKANPQDRITNPRIIESLR